MRGLLLLAVLCALAASPAAAAAQRRGGAAKPAAEGPCALTPELLTSTDWRLYSKTFQVVRAAGVAIRLKPDGTVACDDIAWVVKWELGSDGTVRLLEADGTAAYAFRLDAQACVLTSLDCADESTSATAMGARGTNFGAYFAKVCPSRFGGRGR